MALARRGFLGRLFAVGSVAAAGTVLPSKAKASPPEIDAAHLEAIQESLTREETQRIGVKRKEYEEWLANAEKAWNELMAEQARRTAAESEIAGLRKWQRNNFQRETDYANGRAWTGTGVNDALARTYNRDMFNGYQKQNETFWRGMGQSSLQAVQDTVTKTR